MSVKNNSTNFWFVNSYKSDITKPRSNFWISEKMIKHDFQNPSVLLLIIKINLWWYSHKLSQLFELSDCLTFNVRWTEHGKKWGSCKDIQVHYVQCTSYIEVRSFSIYLGRVSQNVIYFRKFEKRNRQRVHFALLKVR